MANSGNKQCEVDNVSVGSTGLTSLATIAIAGLDSLAVEIINDADGSRLADFQVWMQVTDDGDWFPLFVAADWADNPVGAMLPWMSANSPASLEPGDNSAFVLTNLRAFNAIQLLAESTGTSGMTVKYSAAAATARVI